MRTLVAVVIASLFALGAARAQEHGAHANEKGYAGLVDGLQVAHHRIATSNPDAQRFFDQGLTLVYAFNHDEAVRAFRRAAALDPKAAMPHWGIALALGPNINLDVDPVREAAAYDAVQHAKTLAKRVPRIEQEYIDALTRRYSKAPDADLRKLAVDYSEAMAELSKRHPDDLDAATLYAESLMDLRPWRLWTPDGKPADGTETIVRILESVLRCDPEHVGANHYYIHAVEASPHPERALPSAQRLETGVPAAGHLVHMPAHVYMRIGRYDEAARSNEAAIQTDRKYLSETGVEGVYPLMYYNHNVQFLGAARAMEGRFSEAKRAAEELAANASAGVREMPMLEFAVSEPLFVELRSARWADVLARPAPDASLSLTTALWRFGRGVAFAATNRPKEAAAERDAFRKTRTQVPESAVFGGTGLNSARTILDLAGHVLDARIALARNDRDAAVDSLEEAVKIQDGLIYDEPPAWYYPVRESLGAALLRDGNAVDAERVFRADLERNPNNGRSLFGLTRSLEAQRRTADADFVRTFFDRAWKNAEIALRLEDL